VAAVRVLHVIGQMNRAGVETWLVQVLRNLDPTRVQLEFLALRPGRGDYDGEIERLGSAVIPCGAAPTSPFRFARRFAAVLRERGPYQVVHSHVHHFSGFVLALARRAEVPVRIAHVHMDSSALDAAAGPARRAYLRLMEAAVRRHATHGFAVSEAAAASLFGAGWREDERWAVARCGLDFSAFRAPAEVASIRASLGVPRDAVVLGHVGRFDAWKNQSFLVRIAAAAVRRDPRAFLVLVGDGALRERVASEAAALGVRDRVAFLGLRDDVPRVMRSFDVFVFPSLHEGLPLVGIEAQAAGLPIVLADHLTRELAVIPELFTWVPLSTGPAAWADAALSAVRARAPAADSIAALERSDFSLQRSVSGLLAAYGATA
jgi:glycosyltransferase involved in cell wall biosynthesis